MKKIIIIIGLVLTNPVFSYSQSDAESISFELRYPIPMGDHFINKAFDHGYSGLIDLGLDYNILNANGLEIGILFNTSILELSHTDVNLLIFSPKIKADYEMYLNALSIIPQVGIGYSNWRFRSPEMTFTDGFGNPVRIEGIDRNENGLTIVGATKLVLNNDKKIKWDFNLSYEFTKLEKPDYEGGDVKYNRNIHLFYPAMGMIWNFGESRLSLR